VPHVGTVVISHLPLLVIHDRATKGRRFYLEGVQAGECLSFLKANPTPSATDVRAACPGTVTAGMRNRAAKTPTTKP
jgi:hypothetical protein